MKKTTWIALLSLGAGALAATSFANASRSQATASSASAASTSAPVAAVDSEGFRPSEFAGVSVRERPSASSGAASKRAWVAIKPGGKMPQGIGVRRASGVALRKGKGTTRLGGSTISGSALMHSDVAVRDSKGRPKYLHGHEERKAR